MPKATLTFNLPDEQSDYNMAQSAGDMYYMLTEIQQLMRKYRKYSDFADPEWYRKSRRKHSVFPSIKKRYQPLADARSSFFDKLDNEISAIITNLPEVE